MAKLTDKQKKKILADYVINGNKSETARMNNVTETTVRELVKNKKNLPLEKIEQKAEENTKDILEYIDTQFDKQREVIDLTMKALKLKLKKVDMFTNVKDLATVYGIFTDKALKSRELKIRSDELDKTKKDVEDMTTLADLLGFKNE